MALLLVMLVVTIGLATIAGVQGTYSASRGNVATMRAAGVARMGIEDLKVKLAKDRFFPDGVANDTEFFSFDETVLDEKDLEMGYYTCTVDWSEKDLGHYILTSVGTLGEATQPIARYQIRTRLNIETFETENWTEGNLDL